jgi:two-component system LytT family sensor kinase
MEIVLTEDQFILVTLLVKIGVTAALASVVIRYDSCRRMLFAKRGEIKLALLIGLLLAAGVQARLLLNYKAADLSLIGTSLVGLLLGTVPAIITGCMTALPAEMQGEYLAMPMEIFYGFIAGFIHNVYPRKEEIWQFSPLPFTNASRFIKQWWRFREIDWTFVFPIVVALLELLRIIVSRKVGQSYLFSLAPHSTLVLLAILYTTVSCLAVPLKIWNSTRMELLLKEREALLLQAKYDALKSQINPHFLFNTLNSIASSIRTNPEVARQLIVKLSGILRRLIGNDDHFVPLREELECIDMYLDIEMVRFGREKLRIEREIDPRTLDVMIPSMVLQPLVENAVRHGISPQVGGGTIRITTTRDEWKTTITVEDDGVGIPQRKIGQILELGVGISNVNERLKVIFGPEHQLQVESLEGKGTSVCITIPNAMSARR